MVEEKKDAPRAFLQEAVEALKINVPYYMAEVREIPEGMKVTFYLYGGEERSCVLPLDEIGPVAADQKDVEEGPDLTYISGIGPATNSKLKDAGIVTFKDLQNAPDEVLLRFFSVRVMQNIKRQIEMLKMED